MPLKSRTTVSPRCSALCARLHSFAPSSRATQTGPHRSITRIVVMAPSHLISTPVQLNNFSQQKQYQAAGCRNHGITSTTTAAETRRCVNWECGPGPFFDSDQCLNALEHGRVKRLGQLVHVGLSARGHS